MSEYQQSLSIQAPADSVFEFVSDLNNLPRYLPTVTNTQPQQGERVRVQGEVQGHQYDSDGHFRVDRANRRMEWGSDGENNYTGWMEVTPTGHNCEVTVHLSFVPRPEQDQQFIQQSGSRDKTITDGIQRSLQSIQNFCESKGGKVESPVTSR